jgi:hypothetical protein
MVVRKQVSNPDMKYRRMGIIGALRIVSTIADVNASMNCSSSQVCLSMMKVRGNITAKCFYCDLTF